MLTGQGTVTAASGTVTLVQLPSGPFNAVIINLGTGVIYLGAAGPSGTAVTTTSGMPVPSGGVVTFHGYPGNPACKLRAVAPAGTSIAGFLVSTAFGGLAQPGTQ